MSVRHGSRFLFDAIPVSRPSSYICRQCRHDLKRTSQLAQQRRYASNDAEDIPNKSRAGESRTEKLRKALWKGKPPGPENIDDVYGGPGFFATVAKERKERSTEQRADNNVQAENNQLKQRPEQQTKQIRATTKEKSRPKEEIEEVDEDKDQIILNATTVRTWDGLKAIGHLGDWREMPVKAVDSYVPWTNYGEKTVWTYDNLVSLMHQAIVSHYADVANPQQARINVAEDGTVSGIDVGATEDNLQENSPPGGQVQSPDATMQSQLYEPNDTSFLDARLNLRNSQTFAILQKFTFLTRHRIPDPLLTALASTDPTKNTLRHFLQQFADVTKAKPVNLADILLQDEKLAAQSNLLIMPRRETPVDKEKEVGRWKIIEAELKARGLPVLGKVQVQR